MSKKEKRLNLLFLNKLIKTKSDDNFILNNPIIGEIVFPYGTFGDIRNKNKPKGGYGLEHIIQTRYEKNAFNKIEIVGLCLCIINTIKYGKIYKLRKGQCILEKDKIFVVIKEEWKNEKRKWVITGFPEILKKDSKIIKKEAMDTILTVNAKYSYIVGYSSFCNQVGAVIASINIIRDKLSIIK